jgi:hypothetical protein
MLLSTNTSKEALVFPDLLAAGCMKRTHPSCMSIVAAAIAQGSKHDGCMVTTHQYAAMA